MIRPVRRGVAGVALCAFACGSPEPSAEPVTKAPTLDAATVDAAAIGAATDRNLAVLTAVLPNEITATLDLLAEALEPCVGDFEHVDSDGSFRFWFESSCVDGGVEGFAIEESAAYDPQSPYNLGVIGSHSFALWLADAWIGDNRVWGTAEWGTTDHVLHGQQVRARWFEGDLGVDPPASRPSWFVGDLAPNAVITWTEEPDGTARAQLDGVTALDDRQFDAMNVTELVVGRGCDEVSGIVSIHARGGGWSDLTLTTADADETCRGCGTVTDEHGADLGETCIQLDLVVEEASS